MVNITSKEQFEEVVLRSSIPVLVDFYAVWCGPCKMLTPEVEALSEAYQGKALVVKVNIDDLPELTNSYHVMSVPTLLIMKNGNEVNRMVGFRPRKDISAALDGAIS